MCGGFTFLSLSRYLFLSTSVLARIVASRKDRATASSVEFLLSSSLFHFCVVGAVMRDAINRARGWILVFSTEVPDIRAYVTARGEDSDFQSFYGNYRRDRSRARATRVVGGSKACFGGRRRNEIARRELSPFRIRALNTVRGYRRFQTSGWRPPLMIVCVVCVCVCTYVCNQASQ